MSKHQNSTLPLDLWTAARFVRNKRECFILYYQTDPATGIKIRFRPTHNLNRIKDPTIQERRAREICAEINALLPSGYPFRQEEEKQNASISIEEAIRIAMSIKRQKIKNDKSYNAYEVQKAGIFQYLWERDMMNVDISIFDRVHAFKYIDYIQKKNEITNRTVNNYVIILRSLFFVLVERGVVKENPFSKFPKLKVEKRNRREFNDYERKVVAKYIHDNDPLLFLAVMLCYYCFLRPKDIRHIKFGQFDFKKQLIFTPAGTSKNAQDRYVTMPGIMVAYLAKMKEFDLFPPHYYVFGENAVPGTKKIGHNTMNLRHKKILAQLLADHYLDDIEGLSLYSWKYTGNQALFDRNINLMEIQRQNRHHSITVTQVYAERYHPENPSIMNLDHDILK